MIEMTDNLNRFIEFYWFIKFLSIDNCIFFLFKIYLKSFYFQKLNLPCGISLSAVLI